MTLTYKVYIDMDRDGSFATAGDDITNDVMAASWFNGMREPFQLTAAESRLTLTVRNYDKKYSPENASGTHYGKLLPQRPVRVDGIYNGSTATLYRGWAEEFQPAPGTTGELTTVISCIGPKQFLSQSKIYLGLMQDVTADQVLEAILGQVIFPANTGSTWLLGLIGSTELGVSTYLVDVADTAYAFDTGVTRFPYVADNWENGIKAYDAILSVMDAERGQFYFNREGSAVFLNRSARQADITNDGTVADSAESIDYSYGADIMNVVRVTVSPRTISAGTVDLWALESALRVDAGGTKTVRARYLDDSGGMIAGYNVGTPTPTMDTGITLDSFTENASGAELTFINGGATAGYVYGGTISGQKMTSWNRLEVEEMDQESRSLYGLKELTINAALLDSEEQGRYVAQYELARRSNPRGQVYTISLSKPTATVESLMFNRTLNDRINVQETQTAHNNDYFIVGEEWNVSNAMKETRVKWTVEPAFVNSFAILDLAGYGELDDTARLGF